jgi:ATP-dependent Clp protease, protease subunit
MSKEFEDLQASLEAKKAEGRALMNDKNATADEINAKADEIKAIEAKIEELGQDETQSGSDSGAVYAENIAAIGKQYPGVLGIFEKSVRTNERQRIKDIDDIAGQIAPALVNMAKYEKPMTAKDLAFEQMKRQQTMGGQFLKDFAGDTEKSGVKDIEASPATGLGSGVDDEQRRKEYGKKLRDSMKNKLGRK